MLAGALTHRQNMRVTPRERDLTHLVDLIQSQVCKGQPDRALQLLGLVQYVHVSDSADDWLEEVMFDGLDHDIFGEAPDLLVTLSNPHNPPPLRPMPPPPPHPIGPSPKSVVFPSDALSLPPANFMRPHPFPFPPSSTAMFPKSCLGIHLALLRMQYVISFVVLLLTVCKRWVCTRWV